MEILEAIFSIALPVGLLLLGYGAGRYAETRHYQSIHEREESYLDIPAVTTRSLDDSRPIAGAELATGSVVISVDYFKRFLSSFRLLFGGELRSYSPLIDRGRREALLRMKESCPDAHLYLNCRLETSTISNGRGNAVGTVEILAYATAVRFAEESAGSATS